MLLDRIDAPLPVDRLCELVEMGIGAPHDWHNDPFLAVLSLLASSGHSKGQACIEYCRQISSKPYHLWDRRRLRAIEMHAAKWQAARTFIVEGKVPTGLEIVVEYAKEEPVKRKYQPSPATLAMRRLYVGNPRALEWDGKYDDAYLAERCKATLPLLRDREKCILSTNSGYGRFYEANLAPLIMDWMEGRKEGLEAAWGGPLPDATARTGGDYTQAAMVTSLLDSMTGDSALKAKMLLVRTDRLRDHSHSLRYHDPELWLKELMGLDANPRIAAALLRGLSEAKRPATPEERKALPGLLSQPRMVMPAGQAFEEGEDFYIQLAKEEPDAFREALKAEHLSMPVVNAILVEKLYDDKALVLARIEYAMLNDYASSTGSQLTPERLAKMPPDVRARAEERMKQRGGAPSRRLNSTWLDILKHHFSDTPDELRLLEKLAADPALALQRPILETRIREILRAHPDWKQEQEAP